MQSLFTLDEVWLEYPTIYGISSPAKHWRLASKLSQHSDLTVLGTDGVDTFDKESNHAAYTIEFLDDSSKSMLIRNKGDKKMFHPKVKEVDYLLCSLQDEEISLQLISIVRELKDVSVCFALEQPQQKEIVNFTQLI